MIPRTSRVIAVIAAAALVAAACGDDDDDSAGTEAPSETETPEETDAAGTTAATEDTAEEADTTEPTEDEAETTAADDDEDAAADGWTANTDDCIDPDRANEPIEGTIKIASSGPLSGGPAAAAFAPVIDGYRTYIDYANENELVPGYELELTVGDDQYDPALTPGVINGALDGGANLVFGMVGTPNNLAVRDLLNEECVPQLLGSSGAPELGEVAEYPWTTGTNLPYNVEAAAYAEDIGREFPDGATAAMFYVNNDAGVAFRDGFSETAEGAGIEIVDEQTIEAPDTAPPAAQVSSIAGEAPDVILAFPLGAQCPAFLSELANAKAANPGWEPRVYLTATCASPLILAIAGEAADGLYTAPTFGTVDVSNPATHEIPGVATYLESMEAAGLSDTVPTSGAGWLGAEVVVEILRQAAESPDGLTQASIMNTARNLEYVPTMAREGVVYKTSGEEDGYFVEDVQIVQYDAANGYFNDVGELITSFRSS